MKVMAMQLENVRAFQHMQMTHFSSTLNVLVGPNNSGKSTIISSIFMLQREVLGKGDVTLGREKGSIRLHYNGEHPTSENIKRYSIVAFEIGTGSCYFSGVNRSRAEPFPRIPENEPKNLIYPYLSKRKTVSYSDKIDEKTANSVTGDFQFLFAKIDRLNTSQFPPNKLYVQSCREILGFEVATFPKGSGKQAVVFAHDQEFIPLTAMGEGIANMLGLIVDLCMAEERIFLIEEPENDIHPQALKALLRLVIEKSKTNQFFISTHSNIVMRYLGGVEGAKVFKVANDTRDSKNLDLQVSTISEIPDKPEARRLVLEEMGYDLVDFDLWSAWLFLEEASAETIIRDYLVKWFVPSLEGKLRTFSANGVTNVEPKFEDFNRLFVFLHLQSTYKNRAWVVVDGGENEKSIIDRMKEKYTSSGWDEKNFKQLSQHNFESYYPTVFQSEIDIVLAISDRPSKRVAKKELVEKVKAWIVDNEKRAKAEFDMSAREVIEILIEIDVEIKKNNRDGRADI